MVGDSFHGQNRNCINGLDLKDKIWVIDKHEKASVEKKKKMKKCGERGSNTRPSDLQSDALPTELSPLVDVVFMFISLYLLYC